ncbi:ceramide synthase 5 isoform X2 [Podarcis muralis]|uniref:ceramide synthase 5 isoform X2 n=1 Tax=Podarcis muralis TaxID=64176 RepID=UPI0010A04A93|nr:ceramide synthase 5 isoform X2 [Podarcis muralis]
MAAAATAAAAWLWSGLWNERFWFPANVSWADLERQDPGVGEVYPLPRHVWAAFPGALGLFALRQLFERFIARPCAALLNIQNCEPRTAQPNAILEKVFTSITKCPDARRLEGLSKQLDWDVRKIQRWFRHRRNKDKPSTHVKFCESMWRLAFYICIFTYGLRILWLSPWLWDTRQCWYNYPFQPLSSSLYYYYFVQLAFYWSLMFSQFIDVKRKVAKISNYAKYQRVCDATFVLFCVVFIVTRLGIYPFWLLNTTLFESKEIIGPYPSWWLFNGLLLILQVLNVIWSYFIIRIAYKALARGKVLKDERSDVESSSEEEDVTSSSRKGVLSSSSNDTSRINGHITSGQWAEEE